MDKKNKTNEPGLFKSILLAHGILALHVILVAVVGLVIIFFQGIAKYWIWIFIGIMATVIGCSYFIYRHIKSQGRTLGELLNSPTFKGKSVEVSVLGGLASLKIGEPNHPRPLAIQSEHQVAQLEDPDTKKVREIVELARLLEKKLITPEEYNQAKQKLLGD
jgi:hypothetical protein